MLGKKDETKKEEPKTETRLEKNAKTAPMAMDMQQRQGESLSSWKARLDAQAPKQKAVKEAKKDEK